MLLCNDNLAPSNGAECKRDHRQRGSIEMNNWFEHNRHWVLDRLGVASRITDVPLNNPELQSWRERKKDNDIKDKSHHRNTNDLN